MSMLYSPREPMAALGKPRLTLSIAFSCPGPCCLHPEGCDMVENDLPASQHIPYLGSEHCVFAFPPNAGKEQQALPQLETSVSFSQEGDTLPFLSRE